MLLVNIQLQWNPLNGIPVNRFIRLMGSFFTDLHGLFAMNTKVGVG
jgi:hypothetical protein